VIALDARGHGQSDKPAGDAAKGGFCPPEIVREVRTLNPTIVVLDIASAGHQLRREALGEYVDAVRSFLDAHG
jgi:pimeloyl-ACP methyl ester carboxylesterase